MKNKIMALVLVVVLALTVLPSCSKPEEQVETEDTFVILTLLSGSAQTCTKSIVGLRSTHHGR